MAQRADISRANKAKEPTIMVSKYLDQYYRIQGMAEQLGHESEGVMNAFADLQKQAFSSGALSSHAKHLMALAIVIVLRSDDCVATYVHDALQAGASRAEIMEVIDLAILMGGAPVIVYAGEALEALEQL
jgi:alkylhydroperoxidase/carboxymuconolactone decarboxylase family protein YurZ